jgi:hypothetical protein
MASKVKTSGIFPVGFIVKGKPVRTFIVALKLALIRGA